MLESEPEQSGPYIISSKCSYAAFQKIKEMKWKYPCFHGVHNSVWTDSIY